MKKTKPDHLKQETSEIKTGFDSTMIELQINQIIPLKIVTQKIRTTPKFQQILASVREVGIIEPPVVTKDHNQKDSYILLDGHLRLEILKELGFKEITCLISSDNESFTYNKHISRLSPIQEHKMILQAVERGVPEEKIAKALNIDNSRIIMRKNLLNGICDEAVGLLKDKMVPLASFGILRQMKDERQAEVANLMCATNCYSYSYASALLAGTAKEQLRIKKAKKVKGLDSEQMARMENEMGSVQRDFKLLQETYGLDVLKLTFAKGYVASLLSNARIVRYLAQHHNDVLTQFQKIADMNTLTRRETVMA